MPLFGLNASPRCGSLPGPIPVQTSPVPPLGLRVLCRLCILCQASFCLQKQTMLILNVKMIGELVLSVEVLVPASGKPGFVL